MFVYWAYLNNLLAMIQVDSFLSGQRGWNHQPTLYISAFFERFWTSSKAPFNIFIRKFRTYFFCLFDFICMFLIIFCDSGGFPPIFFLDPWPGSFFQARAWLAAGGSPSAPKAVGLQIGWFSHRLRMGLKFLKSMNVMASLLLPKIGHLKKLQSI